MPRISVITAFYNEAENLSHFQERVLGVLRKLGMDYQIVLVDDHSSDGSPEFARRWAEEDSSVCYIRLSRNCGSHAAFSAGLAECTGDCAVLLAADLQDPPEMIPNLLARWHAGFQVVWAARAGREGESWLTKLCARIYYQLMRSVAKLEVPAQGADFLLMDRKVIDAYNSVREKNTSFLAMILWLGFRQTSLEYVKQARYSGRSKWSFAKKIKLWVDSLVSFSYTPIRLASVTGLCISLLGFLYALVVVVNAVSGCPIQGWSSLMIVVLLVSGAQLLILGMLGEYLWRTFDEVRGRPRYLIEEKRSHDSGQDGKRAA